MQIIKNIKYFSNKFYDIYENIKYKFYIYDLNYFVKLYKKNINIFFHSTQHTNNDLLNIIIEYSEYFIYENYIIYCNFDENILSNRILSAKFLIFLKNYDDIFDNYVIYGNLSIYNNSKRFYDIISYNHNFLQYKNIDLNKLEYINWFYLCRYNKYVSYNFYKNYKNKINVDHFIKNINISLYTFIMLIINKKNINMNILVDQLYLIQSNLSYLLYFLALFNYSCGTKIKYISQEIFTYFLINKFHYYALLFIDKLILKYDM